MVDRDITHALSLSLSLTHTHSRSFFLLFLFFFTIRTRAERFEGNLPNLTRLPAYDHHTIACNDTFTFNLYRGTDHSVNSNITATKRTEIYFELSCFLFPFFPLLAPRDSSTSSCPIDGKFRNFASIRDILLRK